MEDGRDGAIDGREPMQNLIWCDRNEVASGTGRGARRACMCNRRCGSRPTQHGATVVAGTLGAIQVDYYSLYFYSLIYLVLDSTGSELTRVTHMLT